MAEAYGKLTGRPGIALVTRGPGATNAAVGIHTAAQDSTPMMLLVGQVGTDFVDREAFQEIDYRRMYGSVAKWAAQIDRVERIPEYVAHAFRIALAGRPGPVVLALPEDMLTARADVADAPRVDADRRRADRRADDRATARRCSRRRSGRWCIVGGSRWDATPARRCARFAGAHGSAGRLRVPASGPVRQPPSELRRRRRHRHQPEARGARARRRRAAGHRRAAGRDDDVRATRCSTRRCRGRR